MDYITFLDQKIKETGGRIIIKTHIGNNDICASFINDETEVVTSGDIHYALKGLAIKLGWKEPEDLVKKLFPDLDKEDEYVTEEPDFLTEELLERIARNDD